MDINKFEQLLDINYSRKQLKSIFFDAACRNIKNPELDNIKEALYEIIPIGQYSLYTFSDLIQILKILPADALKSIENGEFINIYNKVAQLQRLDKRDFTICNNLLLLIYTNYKNINKHNT